ncbi:lycopene cyclase family protein [Saccharopolyspora rectivirgula]|uniref:lycopene cyclase family protein n=1 Tax=Saccharopolyspora rectivirgula TaxID=28042 RepID=UPI0024090F6B|nr:lycopene cyclase family protein [Saccharopolyspora rectivirgula]
MVDVVVVGGGVAGRAVAAACSDIGLQVALVAMAPRQGWGNTYSSWLDELPAALPDSTLAAVMPRMRSFGTTWHEWSRAYAVLDNTQLWKHLWRPEVTEVAGRVVAAEHGATGSTVVLQDGRRVATAVVIDASGSARVLLGGRPPRPPTEQTAVGAVFHASDVRGVLDNARTGVFMDWHPAPRTRGGWPTFLYAVHLDDDRVLLEETALARRPGLPLALLRRRLAARLEALGIDPDSSIAEERVKFPLDDPLPRPGRVVPFGAAAGFVHPTSGFSVARALRQAPWVAAAISAGLTSSPAAAARAAWAVLWPPRVAAAHLLHRQALRALLHVPPDGVPEFFEQFLSLPHRHQKAFLAVEGDAAETSAAMSELFRRAPWRLRRRLLLAGLPGGVPIAQRGFGKA